MRSRLKLERHLPLYHFDVADGGSSLPCEGVELASLDAARAIACDYAGALLQEQSPSCSRGEYFTLIVSDARRSPLFTITVLTSDAPAVGDAQTGVDRHPSGQGLHP